MPWLPTLYTFYAIADRPELATAKWYRTYLPTRRRGFVDQLAKAKVWSNGRQAKAKCTQLGPSAQLVEFTVSKVTVIDNAKRAREAAEKRALYEEGRRQSVKKMLIDVAKLEVERAQERLRQLQEE